LVLDSPANRNALSTRLRTELHEALCAAVSDDSVRSIVLTHAGSVFCSGADLKEARNGAASTDAPTVPQILVEIWRSPKPVIAAISGAARAGGLGLIAACDIVIADKTVTFACTEVRLGVVPAVISAVMSPRMVASALHRMYLTGETVTAEWAQQAGLVDIVAERGVQDELEKCTEAFALAAPGALAATKALTRTPEAIADLRAKLVGLGDLSTIHFGSEEGREGLAAFAEKRQPNWVR
jgi:methylglutaconyl-CoA hydratase